MILGFRCGINEFNRLASKTVFSRGRRAAVIRHFIPTDRSSTPIAVSSLLSLRFAPFCGCFFGCGPIQFLALVTLFRLNKKLIFNNEAGNQE
jgi:hypothetical protein